MEYKQALKQNAHEAKRVDNEIKRQDQDNGALLEQLEAKQTEYGRLEDRKLDVVSEAELHVFKKEAVSLSLHCLLAHSTSLLTMSGQAQGPTDSRKCGCLQTSDGRNVQNLPTFGA